MKPVSVHQHYRTLRTFCRWLYRGGQLESDPMADIVARCPKTLPRVPTDDDVRRLLAACDQSSEGRRNRALIGLLADSALRREEARRLRITDLDMNTRTLRVHQGKGRKDGVGFFGEATASLLRTWLAVHPDPRPACWLFVTREGVQLGPTSFVRILHRISRRAKLDRPIGPHALRHYAATAILRRTGDLELVRRVLRHETLTMALRYATLTSTEVAAKFAVASPMDYLNVRREVARR
jgi:site-specific recombinase XerD